MEQMTSLRTDVYQAYTKEVVVAGTDVDVEEPLSGSLQSSSVVSPGLLSWAAYYYTQ